MATFIGLINWTDQGIRNYRDSLKRSEAFEQVVQDMGGSVTGLWWTIGPYDIVSVFEAPDEAAATAGLLKIGALGNIRSTTLRGFAKDEFEAIIAKAE
jgi:uncharacterized protein with GYD domain